jgi:hypothetical protein
MNKNNGLLMGIAGFIVVVGIIIIVTVTNKNSPTVVVPDATPVAVTTPSEPKPAVEEPYVQPEPVVSLLVVVPVIKTPIKTPTAPSNAGRAPTVSTLGASSLSSGGVVLNGLLNTHNAETYYSFQYGTASTFGLSTRFAPIDGSNATVAVTLAAADLMPGTTYYYRLNAQNAFGKAQGETRNFSTPNANGTVVINQTTTTDPRALGVVTQEVSSISQNEAVLNGRLVTHNVETYYSFKYGTTSSLGLETRVAPIAGSNDPSDITLAVFNLSPDTVYYYQLHAHNQYGIVSDSIRQFTTAR